MTGLNLETFLHLLRADFGAWVTLGLIAVVLALMAWTSWGSRRALRKCLVLSVLAHCGLALYGGTIPVVLLSLRRDADNDAGGDRIRKIQVSPWVEGGADPVATGPHSADGRGRGALAPWDKPVGGLALADVKRSSPMPDLSREELVRRGARPAMAADSTAPDTETPTPPKPEERPKDDETSPPPPRVTPAGTDDVAPAVVASRSETEPAGSGLSDSRLRPERVKEAVTGTAARRMPSTATSLPDAPMPDAATPESEADAATALAERPREPIESRGEPPGRAAPAAPGEVEAAEVVKDPVAPRPRLASPETDVRRRSRPERPSGAETVADESARRRPAEPGPLALSRVTPNGVPALPAIQGATGGRPLADVPEVYRSRLDPNRSARAYRAGASPASEQAVERALDWLARHQDTDGRWDGATAKYDDGTAVKGDDDFTVHCPPGETCFGECVYWEADTALTGLALLAYLGAGYTQTDGKYAETVGKGLDALLLSQKPDGDLRGRSRAVGMYCHAMATIALCEAYALTGDERLREPVERAIRFLARSRARDGLAWRYAPGAPTGDTSILGWVVMALKSAKEVGIPVPASVQTGTLGWLSKVSSGPDHGLARYQPWDPVTPTMTAEAWVCRQFLGNGGPGPASTEAADYLLAHGPKSDTYNLYYWYYGTLAMYQHGGHAWARWNAEVRDEIVRRQRLRGHPAGSWDPDDSPYGAKGGRIYCTALATLSLEVYYRYLRLYDEPKIPPAFAPARPRTLGRLDAGSEPGRPSTAGPKR